MKYICNVLSGAQNAHKKTAYLKLPHQILFTCSRRYTEKGGEFFFTIRATHAHAQAHTHNSRTHTQAHAQLTHTHRHTHNSRTHRHTHNSRTHTQAHTHNSRTHTQAHTHNTHTHTQAQTHNSRTHTGTYSQLTHTSTHTGTHTHTQPAHPLYQATKRHVNNSSTAKNNDCELDS